MCYFRVIDQSRSRQLRSDDRGFCSYWQKFTGRDLFSICVSANHVQQWTILRQFLFHLSWILFVWDELWVETIGEVFRYKDCPAEMPQPVSNFLLDRHDCHVTLAISAADLLNKQNPWSSYFGFFHFSSFLFFYFFPPDFLFLLLSDCSLEVSGKPLSSTFKMAALRTPPERLLRPFVRAVSAHGRQTLTPRTQPNGKRMYRAAVCKDLGKPLIIEDVPAVEKLKSSQVCIYIYIYIYPGIRNRWKSIIGKVTNHSKPIDVN